MNPGEDLPVHEEEEPDKPSEGSTMLNPAEEILSANDPTRGGNPLQNDLIITQPQSAAVSRLKIPEPDGPTPACPKCGLAVPDRRRTPVSRGPTPLRSSGSSFHGSRRGSGQTKRGDRCFQLLMACLSCQCSVLLLSLLEGCSSGLHALCSSCCTSCSSCTSCCSDIQEELHCNAHWHSVMLESCCEPTECLEFCMEFCDICHRGK